MITSSRPPPRPSRADLRAVLLDIDGTLVDSNDAHARSWHEVLSRHGRAVPLQAVRDAIGKGGDKLLRELGRLDDESEEGKAIIAERKELFTRRWVPELRPFPDVRALVQRLKARGLRIAVATSASEEEAKTLLDIAQVSDLIEESTSSDDAERSKPDPDIVQAALLALDLAPQEAILIGDTPYDVAAAHRAGVAVVAVESGGWKPADLAPALAVYRDAADLLARFDSSPFAEI
jgi:HAD superfamily hydrolase (TIGR01509 family)